MLSFEHLKNKYSGSRCVVFGNGPSLTIELIQQIQEADLFTFAANGFCLLFDKIDFRPSAVCMSNYDAIQKFGASYTETPFKFFKAGWQNHTNLEHAIGNVYDLPFSCNHDLGQHGSGFIKDRNFTLDPSQQNYCGDTVLLDFAIPLAFYMGFHEIYLCGVDCDYSKGYFSKDYTISARSTFKGMVNGDYSIAIPSYQYTKDFLTSHGRHLYKLTHSTPLSFIETSQLQHALRKSI